MSRGYSAMPFWGLSRNFAVVGIFRENLSATYSAHYRLALKRVSLKSQRPNARNAAVSKFRS